MAASSRRAPPPPLSPPAIFFGHSAARSFAHAPAPPLGNFPPPDRAAFCSFFPSFLPSSVSHSFSSSDRHARWRGACGELYRGWGGRRRRRTGGDCERHGSVNGSAAAAATDPARRRGHFARSDHNKQLLRRRTLARSLAQHAPPLLSSPLLFPRRIRPTRDSRGEGGRQVTLIARCVVGRHGAKGKEGG